MASLTPSMITRLRADLQRYIGDPSSGVGAMDMMAVMAIEHRMDSLSDAERVSQIAAVLLGIAGRTGLSHDVRTSLDEVFAGVDGMPSFAYDAKAEARAAIKAMARGRFGTEGVDLEEASRDPEESESEANMGEQIIDFGEDTTPVEMDAAARREAFLNTVGPILAGAFIKACSMFPQGADGRDLLAAIGKATKSKNPTLELALAFSRADKVLAQAIPRMAAQHAQIRKDMDAAGIESAITDRVLAHLDSMRQAIASGGSGAIVALIPFFLHAAIDEPVVLKGATTEAPAGDGSIEMAFDDTPHAAPATAVPADPLADALAAIGVSRT